MMPDEDWETIGCGHHSACDTMLTVDDVALSSELHPRGRIREFHKGGADPGG